MIIVAWMWLLPHKFTVVKFNVEWCQDQHQIVLSINKDGVSASWKRKGEPKLLVKSPWLSGYFGNEKVYCRVNTGYLILSYLKPNFDPYSLHINSNCKYRHRGRKKIRGGEKPLCLFS